MSAVIVRDLPASIDILPAVVSSTKCSPDTFVVTPAISLTPVVLNIIPPVPASILNLLPQDMV